jgi:hypothetical protein
MKDCKNLVAFVGAIVVAVLSGVASGQDRATAQDTTVRLNVEENQLVNVFGEFGICLGGLKSA